MAGLIGTSTYTHLTGTSTYTHRYVGSRLVWCSEMEPQWTNLGYNFEGPRVPIPHAYCPHLDDFFAFDDDRPWPT